jgi:molybdopterin-guanine dinucleotide biosynthesis protein A
MGRPKAMLPFGDELLLPRVARILSDVVSPIVVVAAPEQEVPSLPEGVRVVRDEQEYLGPLAGIGVGLAALAGEAEAAYCSGCDVPLLRPAFVRAMIAALGKHELAVPKEGDFHHPLAGVYRTSLVERISGLVAAGRLRPLFLIESSRAAIVDVESLRSVDPRLDSLRNMNRPEEYAAALRDAGLPPAETWGRE